MNILSEKITICTSQKVMCKDDERTEVIDKMKANGYNVNALKHVRDCCVITFVKYEPYREW